MIKILTPADMSLCDARAIGKVTAADGDGLCFMERAARACVDFLEKEYAPASVLVMAGRGNNGGDGIAAARMLTEDGVRAAVCFPEEGTFSAQAEEEFKKMEKTGVPVLSVEEILWEEWDVILDAMLGTGLSRPVTGGYADAIGRINASGKPTVAVDIPSGVDGKTGNVQGIAVKARDTVTMQCPKPGLYLYPGTEYAGNVHVCDLGIGTEYEEISPLYALAWEDFVQKIPPRPKNGNKGTFGKLLVAAGCETMSGAAYLSGKAAYRTGAGLVRFLTHENNRTILATLLPEAIITTYNEQTKGSVFAEAAKWADAAVVGPGIGQSELSVRMANTVLSHLHCPAVIDADALNLLAQGKINCPAALPAIFTPHPGELSRLTGKRIPELLSDLPETAREYAMSLGENRVLAAKDARTVVTDGKKTYLNLTGSSALAKGGSGDTLTGFIASFLLAGCSLIDAAILGTYLHGLAGERLAKIWGERGTMPSDLPDEAARILKETE